MNKSPYFSAAKEEVSQSRGVAWGRIVAGGCLLVGVVLLWWFLSRPVQMGADPEVFKTVDALYTAIRNQDKKQLASCEATLKDHFRGGRLPATASQSLNKVIAKAQSGEWEPAAKSLYSFMLAQRRD